MFELEGTQGVVGRQGGALEAAAAAGLGHGMEEQRHLVVDPGCGGVADDDGPEQPRSRLAW
jgi:hypothetical protein